MTIEKTSQPYEFLIRWDEEGNVKGQHIQYREIVKDTDTGEIYSDKPTQALPVTESGEFPLGEVLSEVHIAQTKAVETKTQEVATEKKRADDTQKSLDTAVQEKDNERAQKEAKEAECVAHEQQIVTLEARVKELEAEVASLTPQEPPVIDEEAPTTEGAE